jgi:hypothetical protein
MPGVNDYLGSARDWHNLHCQELIDAMFIEDEQRCYIELEKVRQELAAAPELTADERRALEYVLLQFEYQIVNRFYEDEEQSRQFAITYPAMTGLPPVGPLSDGVKAKVLIGMLGVGVRRGFISMSEPEVDSLMERIPEEYKTPNIWYYVVVWAFITSNLKYLELAMERQTVETTGWIDDYYWQRTNLMYQLVSKRATKLDIEKTLKGYRHPHHIEDFRTIFLPRCEAMGLMDDELRELHRRRVEELEALRGKRPEGNPTTVHLVKPVLPKGSQLGPPSPR